MTKQSLATFALVWSLAAPILAQSTSSTVSGKITDPSGSSVPAASISASNEDTGLRRAVTSNEEGGYVLPLLPPGRYRLVVQKDGFKPVTRTGIVLQVDQVARIDFVLDVGVVTESVVVTANAPLLDQETSSLGQVVDNTKILSLPLNGRMTFRLVNLTPGIIVTPGSSGQFGDVSVGTFDDINFSINGGRAQSNEVMVDGVPSTTGFLNLLTTVPSVDATQEFKVQSNAMSAEWGRFGGGVINVSTRGGTNQLHGGLFEFVRNSAFDSNEFFNKRAGRAIPPFRMNQFGGSVGGPLRKNRTFFFANYDATRWRRGDIFSTTVPTTPQRAGDFSRTFTQTGDLIVIYDPLTSAAITPGSANYRRTSFPGNMIPANRLDAVGANVVKFYPQPNAPGDPVTQTQNFLSNAARRIDKNEGAIRIDQNWTDRFRMFGRLAVTDNVLGQPDHFRNEATPGVGANGNIQFRYYTASLDANYTLSPAAILNVRYGLARFNWARKTRSYGFDQRSLGMADAVVAQMQIPVFPVIGVEGYSAMAGGSFLDTGQDTHSLLPSITIIRGKHTWKMGGDLRLRRNNLWVISNGGGSYSVTRAFTRGPDPNVFTANAGNGVASLLLGTVASGSIGSYPGASLQNFYYSGYFQDDWRVGKRLTLNIGLRYETETPYTERRDYLAYFDTNLKSPLANAAFPNLTGGLRFVTKDGLRRSAYAQDKNNFSPRIGLAYSLNKRTTIRTGFGVFHGALEVSNDLNGFTPVNGNGFSGSTPFVGTIDSVTPFAYLRNPFPAGLQSPPGSGAGALAMVGQGISSWYYPGTTPYTMQWNFDVQRSVTSNLLVDVAYAGSRGLHLARGYDFNALPTELLAQGTRLQELVDNPFFGRINVGTLAQQRVQRRQLLLPFPQYTGVTVLNVSAASSVYHSLQMKVEKRMSHGQSFLVSFTAAKLIGNSNNNLAGLGVQSNGTGTQDWYNLRGERAISEMDISRSMTISHVAELPFGPGRHFLNSNNAAGFVLGGWNLSTIVTARGGMPLALSAPIPGGGNRPNSTGTSAEITGDRSRNDQVSRWFNTSQFTLPASFTMGNVSRTLPDVRGPGVLSFDFSLAKNVAVKEKLDVQFRAEAFNAFNRPQFWMPNTAFGSLDFGRITASQQTVLPRVMQFAIKLKF
ncbi:MAG: TonB-dependent receptor [Acidobacteria bacterium]|nr:TonB-dependent receptor [Acidobacteriota bacterium]